jgi:hypothetical protein
MRVAVLLAVLALAVAAPGASAQSDPFGPLPPSNPTPAPTPAPVDTDADDGQTGRMTLYGIGGALLVVFLGLGVWITRDARRAVPADHRGPAKPTLREEREHKHERQAKAKARKRARAARTARRRNR